jgi:dTDP-4-dehydrorhamnose reductase
MRILVTGANGQLGSSLRERADDRASWLFTDIDELDITDAAAVRALVEKEGIDTIVNCAGYTNVEAAEDNFELAEKLNAGAVENLAVAMKQVGGLLVHISTDYVFGGKPHSAPIPEDEEPAPQGVYAVTKLHGEEAIRRIGCRYIILRTAWLYSEYGKNFVKTMLRLTSEKPAIKVVSDQRGTPTYAGDLARVIVRLLRTSLEGTFNFTNEGECTWFDFAKQIAKEAGHTSCDIQPCTSEEFPSKVHRPAYSVLDKGKIKSALGISIPHWTDSLKKCMASL